MTLVPTGSFRQRAWAGYWIFQPKEFQQAILRFRFGPVAVREHRPFWGRYPVGSAHPRSLVPPGSFLMGSPPGEVERHAAEVLHRVTFSEGVRMASQIYAKRKVDKQEGGEA